MSVGSDKGAQVEDYFGNRGAGEFSCLLRFFLLADNVIFQVRIVFT